MKISEVKIKAANEYDNKVEAFVQLVLDGEFALHDLRIIRRDDGSTFLQMPSRKMQDKCSNCQAKNYVKARYCNWCGKALANFRYKTDGEGRPILSADIFHPITKEARAWIQNEVFKVRDYRLKETTNAGPI